jgi:S-adenosylmethionine decarboxylase
MTALGIHLLADLHGCQGLADPARIEAALRAAVAATGATLLNLQLHHFGPGQGVTGVALLAESHLSIHSWPEHGFAAIDIFLCGGADPGPALDIIAAALCAARIDARRVPRGLNLGTGA